MFTTPLTSLLTVLVLATTLGFASCRPMDAFEPALQLAHELQLSLLQNMECEPKFLKFRVLDLLPPHNDLSDKKLLTNVVAVRRCSDSCSFCGNRKGNEIRKCQPTKKNMALVPVIYYDTDGQRRYTHFKTEEHLECECLG
ncbi:uncharacterized protein LOC119580305 [Penaeus monodon]|uniref:uncharacterized protein LOC119580305 n=1 Tax=Penaeus monodon TaxID=6687 RepID=UPI0018A715F6|nr:uncharacterized protein LOC119580305 [Penaeus monodon]